MDTDRHAVAPKQPAAPEGAPPGSDAAVESSRHVFISYSRKDRSTADAIVKVLEAKGHKVWIDREDIPGGQNFGSVIDSAIDTAGAVVVLWSKDSAASPYVQDEADRGRARNVLVAARIDGVRLPLGFGRLQTYDLESWDRESTDHPELRRLLSRVRDLAGGSTRRATVIVGPSSRMALRAGLAA